MGLNKEILPPTSLEVVLADATRLKALERARRDLFAGVSMQVLCVENKPQIQKIVFAGATPKKIEEILTLAALITIH